jgi:hypothetical protein
MAAVVADLKGLPVKERPDETTPGRPETILEYCVRNLGFSRLESLE